MQILAYIMLCVPVYDANKLYDIGNLFTMVDGYCLLLVAYNWLHNNTPPLVPCHPAHFAIMVYIEC